MSAHAASTTSERVGPKRRSTPSSAEFDVARQLRRVRLDDEGGAAHDGEQRAQHEPAEDGGRHGHDAADSLLDTLLRGPLPGPEPWRTVGVGRTTTGDVQGIR